MARLEVYEYATLNRIFVAIDGKRLAACSPHLG